jgi:hypothetical protein
MRDGRAVAPELETAPFVAAVLTSQFLDLIRNSGASFEEANCAIKATHALLQCLPLPISVRSDGDES